MPETAGGLFRNAASRIGSYSTSLNRIHNLLLTRLDYRTSPDKRQYRRQELAMLLYAILILPYFPALIISTRRWLAIYAAFCLFCLFLARAKLGSPPSVSSPAFEAWFVSAQVLEYGGFFLLLGCVTRALMLSLGTTGIATIAAAMLLPIFCMIGWLNFLGIWQYAEFADAVASRWRDRPVSTACANRGTTVKIGSSRFRVPPKQVSW